MKKIMICVLVFLSFIFGGCTTEDQDSNNEETNSNIITFTALNKLAFDFPNGWNQNSDENPFDLQCFSKKEDLSTAVFVYDKIDLSENDVAEDYLELQIDDIRSKREYFKFVENIKDTNVNEKKIKTSIYSGEKDGVKNYYIFSLVEINDFDHFAIILQTCFPSTWEKNKPILEGIIDSCKLIN